MSIEFRIWFWLIALGESFLVTGFAFVAQESSVVGVASVLLAFVNTVTLWWLYFDHAERAGAKAIARADKPGRIGNRAYTCTHAINIAGIVLGSVADKEVLGHPDDAMKVSTAIVIVGGVSLGTFVGPRRAARRSAFSEEDAASARVIASAAWAARHRAKDWHAATRHA